MDQNEATELNDVQGKSKADAEKTDLSVEDAETPTNITDNETMFTGNHSMLATVPA